MDINLREVVGNIPPITLLTSIISIVLGALSSVSSSYSKLFFFSKTLCFDKGEWWRLFTSFFYIGPLSFNFAINLVMSAVYSMRLEKTSFYKKSADYAWMLCFGIVGIALLSCIFPSSGFLGMALHSMIIYVWCRKNPHLNVQFIMITMKAPYFPLVLIVFHYISYGRIMYSDIIGMAVGHMYYYLSDILPKIAKIRHWKRTEFMKTPRLLSVLFKDVQQEDEEEPIPNELLQEEVDEVGEKEEEEVAQQPTPPPVPEKEMDDSNNDGEEGLRRRRNSDE